MKVLYVCTHNRCRSILSEAITQASAEGLIEARSAGSAPSGEVYPKTIAALSNAGISTHALSSKSLDDVSDFHPDVVITVCDNAAKEPCPLWLGNTLQLHWNLVDPSKITDYDQQAAAFHVCMDIIRSRVEILKQIAKLPQCEWDKKLQGAVI